MKKMKFISLMLLFIFAASGASAQSGKELDKLLKEMKKLAGEHVEYNDELDAALELDFHSEDDEMELSTLLSDLNLQSVVVAQVSSKDEQGYKMLNTLIEKYELGENDEFASIPLLANEKEGDEITYAYFNDKNFLSVNIVQGEKIVIGYMNYDVFKLLEQLTKGLMELDVDFDDEDFELLDQYEGTGAGCFSCNFGII